MEKEQEEFIERLSELAETLGSKAALARKAGLPLSSLDSYFSGTEPPRRVLNRLAEAGRVNVDWLSRGRGQMGAADAPEGYVAIPYCNLRFSGPHIRAINFLTKERYLIRQTEIDAIGIGGGVFAVGGAEEGLDFPPRVTTGDTLLIEMPQGHVIERPTLAEGWPIEEGSLYLIAEGVELRLRKLQRGKDGTVSVIQADGRVEKVRLTGAPRNVILYGRVFWRAGLLRS